MYMGSTLPHLQKRKKKKKAQKIGTVTDGKASRGTSTPKTLNNPKPMTFLIGIHSRSGCKKEWNEKLECLNEKYNLDYYSSSESDSDFEPEHKYETLI